MQDNPFEYNKDEYTPQKHSVSVSSLLIPILLILSPFGAILYAKSAMEAEDCYYRSFVEFLQFNSAYQIPIYVCAFAAVVGVYMVWKALTFKD